MSLSLKINVESKKKLNPKKITKKYLGGCVCLKIISTHK